MADSSLQLTGMQGLIGKPLSLRPAVEVFVIYIVEAFLFLKIQCFANGLYKSSSGIEPANLKKTRYWIKQKAVQVCTQTAIAFIQRCMPFLFGWI